VTLSPARTARVEAEVAADSTWRAASYQMSGAVRPRCMSLERRGAPVEVWSPATAQLLEPGRPARTVGVGSLMMFRPARRALETATKSFADGGSWAEVVGCSGVGHGELSPAHSCRDEATS